MIKNQPSITAVEFLDLFPQIAPPLILTSESVNGFSHQNGILNEDAQRYIAEMSRVSLDELTEIIPCFKFVVNPSITGIVYWKGALMNYEYVLSTIDNEGRFVSNMVLAGTYSNGKTIITSAATIDESHIIHIVMGEQELSGSGYDPMKSKAYSVEVLPDGKIMSIIEDIPWEENTGGEAKI